MRSQTQGVTFARGQVQRDADACVLVPIALADTLLRLAEADLYRPLWSERIIDEMVSAIEEIHPELAARP